MKPRGKLLALVVCAAFLFVMGAEMINNACAEDIFIAGVKLSMQYAEFTRGTVIDNERENPGLGSTVPYHWADHGESTIYIYNKGLREIPDGPMSHEVRQEFHRATEDVLDMPGGQAELISQYGTGTPERAEFLCAESILTDLNGSRRTFLYVTGASNNFVKIRVALKANNAGDLIARKFADAVASELWSR
jgi:hypothetical protein